LVTVKVISSDSKVWNLGEVITAITQAKIQDQDLVLDLNEEGPDFTTLGLDDYLTDWQTRTTIVTRNAVQSSLGKIKIQQDWPHCLTTTRADLQNLIVDKKIKKPFGCFIGRSNAPRLYLSSYLYNKKCAVQTFHYDPTHEFHRNNLGLEDIMEQHGINGVHQTLPLLSHSPVTFEETVTYPIHMGQHNNIHYAYSDFLVDIVCESYYNGRTFFPTEKTWRPMVLSTPFIVQGPQWHLHRLRDLGKKTFERWWDEGYSEDPPSHQIFEICKVIDSLSQKTPLELNNMYIEMMPVLEHNKRRFYELTSKDFEIFNNDRY